MPTGQNVAEDHDDSDDESYIAEGEDDDETLGSQDTDIDDDEVHDLETDATMPPKKTTATPKKPSSARKSSTKEATSIESLTSDLSKMSMTNKLKPNFTYHLPVIPFHYKNNTKHIIEFLVHYPTSAPQNLKYCKVMPGGIKVAFLIDFPTWPTGKKLLEKQMGAAYREDSARVQARLQQVTHRVTDTYPAGESIHGDPQVIDLPFKCVEGDVKTDFLMTAEGMHKQPGKKHNHQQFQVYFHFKVESADDYKEPLENKKTWQLLDEFNETESEDEEDGDDMNL